MYSDFAHFVAALGPDPAVAKALGRLDPKFAVPSCRITQFRQRNSVPAAFWPAFEALAKQQGLKGVTRHTLADLAIKNHARRLGWDSAEPERAEAA